MKKITQTYIKEGIHYLELKNTIEELKLLFLEISELNFKNSLPQERIFLETGKAIGPG